MNGCCNYWFFFAVSVAAGSFFRLRPSDFSAPKRPLQKLWSAKGDLQFSCRFLCGQTHSSPWGCTFFKLSEKQADNESEQFFN